MRLLWIPVGVVVACALVWPFEMLLVSAFLAFVTIGSSLLADWMGRSR